MECIATCHSSLVTVTFVPVYKPEFQLGEPQLELTCNTSSPLLGVLLSRFYCPSRHQSLRRLINSNIRLPYNFVRALLGRI